MLKSPLVDRTFDMPKHLFPRPFPKPPYDGILMEYADGITLGKLRYTNMTEEKFVWGNFIHSDITFNWNCAQ
jgi:hypothetical protein